jgi:hypothetical protein
MNPIVAIASFWPACCCTVDSRTLINGLIRFSSPEGHNRLMKWEHSLTHTPGSSLKEDRIGSGHMKLWLGSSVKGWQPLRFTHNGVSSFLGPWGPTASQFDSSGLSNVKNITALMAVQLLPPVADACYPGSVTTRQWSRSIHRHSKKLPESILNFSWEPKLPSERSLWKHKTFLS